MPIFNTKLFMEDIRLDPEYAQVSQGSWANYTQFKQIVGMHHHKKGSLQPISKEEI